MSTHPTTVLLIRTKSKKRTIQNQLGQFNISLWQHKFWALKWKKFLKQKQHSAVRHKKYSFFTRDTLYSILIFGMDVQLYMNWPNNLNISENKEREKCQQKPHWAWTLPSNENAYFIIFSCLSQQQQKICATTKIRRLTQPRRYLLVKSKPNCANLSPILQKAEIVSLLSL